MTKEDSTNPNRNHSSYATEKVREAHLASEALILKEDYLSDENLEKMSLEEIKLILQDMQMHHAYRFQSLFNHMSSGAAIYKVLNDGSTGKDYIVLDFNQAALQIEKKERAEVIGKSLFDLRPTIDEYGLISTFQKVWKTGESVIFPSKVYVDDNFHNWYENRIFRLPTGEIVAVYDDVTEKMLTNEKLAESEQKYRQITENISDVVWMTDMEMKINYVSSSVQKMIGCSPETYMEMTMEERFTPDSLGIIHKVLLEELVKEKQSNVDLERTIDVEAEHYREDGSTIWISMHISLLRDENGKTIGFQGVSRDVTERRHMEDQMKMNYKDLLESQRIAHLGTWRLDLSSNQVAWSEELYRMYGFDPTYPPPPYTEHMKLFTPESWHRLSTCIEHTRTVGVPYELELETVTIDGSNGWIWARGEAHKDSQGNIIELWGAAQDITERKKAEYRIKQSEERFQLLFNKAPLGYQSLDFEGRFIEVNQKWIDTLGYSKEEVIGRWFGDFLCPEYVDGFRKRFPVFKSQGYIHSEFEMLSKDGQRLFLSFEGKVGYGADGEFKQTHCILQDITNQRKAEKALIESEERYKYLFEHSGVGIGYYTTDGVVISYNKKAMENIGGKPEDYIGKSFRDLFPKEQAEIYYARIEKAIASDQPQQYEDYISLNSGPKWFSSTYTRVLSITGEVLGVQIASLDITESKQAEEELFFLSYHDHLTGLYNRRFFEDEIKKIDKKENLPLSIIMGDVNGLKLINDSFGHDTGDDFLKKTADAIREACRPVDVIVRLGGDEFAVVLPKTDSAEAQRILASIKNLAANIKIASVALSISVGYDTKARESKSIVDTIANAENDMYRHKIYERSSMRSKTVDIIMNTLFEKSNREMMHSRRVSKICEAIAIAMNFTKDETGQIRTAGLVHDIGKIGIDEKILNKNGRPDEEEWKEIKKHPEIGWRILSSTKEFSELANLIIAHHEKWDGSGYPNGLSGEEIPLEARIIMIADAYDAMTSKRSYRESLSGKEAVEELKRCSGTQFDPKIIDVFLNLVLSRNSDISYAGRKEDDF